MIVSLAFFVPGVPIGQGSKTFVPTAAGPRAKESNEAKLKPWRASIVECAPQLDKLLDGPLGVEATFKFPRPKSHYRTGRFSDVLKQSAPDWHVSAPDSDKLIRALGDALTGVVMRDDSQIARWVVRKLYGDRPGVDVEIVVLHESAL